MILEDPMARFRTAGVKSAARISFAMSAIFGRSGLDARWVLVPFLIVPPDHIA
jgi:hypothetical protein